MATLLPALLLLATLTAQALLPKARILVVVTGAALAATLSAVTGRASLGTLLAEVPWDVMVLLVALGLVSELIASTRIFGVLAEMGTRAVRASPASVFLASCVGMFLVSGLVNNLTALLLVLPILLVVLQLMAVNGRYFSWLMGTLLVACNLGGAATPIGDFPAVLLLSGGRMAFTTYLVQAAPLAVLALVILLGVVAALRPWRGTTPHPAAGPLTVAVMSALYRKVRLRRGLLLGAMLILAAMFAAWTLAPRESGMTPELVAYLGCVAMLWIRPQEGEKALRQRVDVEASLFLLALFIMVGAVRATGVFSSVTQLLLSLDLSEPHLRVLLVVLAMVLTAVFSAGPGMASLLEVADAVARQSDRPHVVYVGLAFGVCAGSSALLTAATSGPLAQALTERAGLRGMGQETLAFGPREHLGPGLLGAGVTMVVGVAYVLLA